jgi:hypothetical protein
MKHGWLLLAITLGLGGGVAACRSEPAGAGCPGVESSSPPIDPPVMAFLSAARALHHEADIREAEGDVPGAIAALERLVAMSAPRAVEVDEVLADARARLAELRLERGDVDGAQRDVEQGLRHVQGPTYFRGHLLEVEGRVEERRAAALGDAGHAAEATKARAHAVSLLEEAVRVQEQVIERALADGGARD